MHAGVPHNVDRWGAGRPTRRSAVLQFSNLCGTVYKCGNIVFTPDGNGLLSPVGNRITHFNLTRCAGVCAWGRDPAGGAWLAPCARARPRASTSGGPAGVWEGDLRAGPPQPHVAHVRMREPAGHRAHRRFARRTPSALH